MNFEAYFSMLQNAAQQVDHENQANKRPVKRVINYLDLTPDEFEELSSPPSVAELSISKAQAKPPPRPREDVQDPNTLHVSYELFIKLPPRVKTLICDTQNAEGGNQPRKVHFQDVYGTMSDDLAPDITSMEQSFYETGGTEDAAPDDNVEDDQQLLAHLTHCKELPPSDIRRVLASQQYKQEKQVMQRSAIANKPKKSITIDGIVYTANVHTLNIRLASIMLISKKLLLLIVEPMAVWLVMT